MDTDGDGVADECGCTNMTPGRECPPGEENPTHGGAGGDGKVTSDPIDLSISEFIHKQVDLSVPGRGLNFQFARTYRGKNNPYRISAFGAAPNGDDLSPMGSGWTHSYQWYVIADTDQGLLEDALVMVTPSGRMEKFDVWVDDPGQTDSDGLGDFNGDGVATDRRTSRREYDGWLTQFGANGSIEDYCEYVDSSGTAYRFERFEDDGFLPNEIDIAYRLTTITDRNGNQMLITYLDDGGAIDQRNGRIDEIVDPLGRRFVFQYDDPAGPHLITSIEELQAGGTFVREVEFAYDSGTVSDPLIDPRVGGRRHDLVEVTQPAIVDNAQFDLPPGHDRFPAGRTWTYSYTDISHGGDPIDRAIDTITNPNGQVVIDNDYATEVNPGAPAAFQPAGGIGAIPSLGAYYIVRQVYGDGEFNYAYLTRNSIFKRPTGDASGPGQILEDTDFVVFVNNRRGRVIRLEYSTSEFTGGNRFGGGQAAPVLLRTREYTGFAAPNALSMISEPDFILPPENPPVGKLDSTAPDYYDTLHTWNGDWQRTGTISPNDDEESIEYYGDTNPLGSSGFDPARSRLMTKRSHTDAATGDEITEEWGYGFAFGGGGCGGCSGGDFATGYADGRGFVTLREFDTSIDPVTLRASGDLLAVYRGLAPGTADLDNPNYNAAASAAASVERFTYNAFGQILTREHPETSIAPSGTPHNRTDTYQYGAAGNANGFLTSMTVDPGGLDLVTAYEYDAAGNVTKVIEPDDDYTVMIYNQADQLVRSSRHGAGGALLARTDFFYDANGNLVREDVFNLVPTTDASTFGIDSVDEAYTTLHAYDDLDNLVMTAQEIGGVTGGTVDGLDLNDGTGRFDVASLASNPDWVVTEYVYDDAKYLVEIRSPEAVDGNEPANTQKMTYDARGFLVRVEHGNAAQRALGEGLLTRYRYDNKGRRIAVEQDGGGIPRTATFAYDGFDRLTSTTSPVGTTTSYEYDDNGNRTRALIRGVWFRDPVPMDLEPSIEDLAETKTVYDGLNRPTERREVRFTPSAPVSAGTDVVYTTAYNDDGSVRSMSAPSGAGLAMTEYLYDKASRLALLEDATGVNSTAYAYDDDSNMVSVTRTEAESGIAQVFATTFAHNGLDQTVSTTEGAFAGGPNNTSETWFDSRGNPVRTVDARGNVTRMAYDGLNRRLTTSREMTVTGLGGGALDASFPGGIETAASYDDNSRLTSLTDDNGNTTVYLYDDLNRQVRETMADGSFAETGYDGFGDPWWRIDANGTSVSTVFDPSGRPVSRSISLAPGVEGTTEERFEYDGLSRVVRAKNDFALVTREYDSRSSLLSERTELFDDGGSSLGSRTVSYAYDDAMNRTSIQHPSGRTISRGHDALNRLVSIDDTTGGGAGSFVAGYTYAGPGHVHQRSSANGVVATYAYNGWDGAPAVAGDAGVGRVTRISHEIPSTSTVIDRRELAWDAAGNKTAHRDTGPVRTNQRDRAFGYDSADRLVSSTYSFPSDPMSDGSLGYTLDGVHNRVAFDIASGSAPITEGQPGFAATFGTGISQPGTSAPDDGAYFLEEQVPVEDFQVNQYTKSPSRDYEYDANGNTTRIAAFCPGDADGDGEVALNDLLTVQGNFGETCTSLGITSAESRAYGDLDGDCLIGLDDQLQVLGAFGSTCYIAELRYDYRNQLVSFTAYDGPNVKQSESQHRYDAFNRRVRKVVDGDGDTLVNDPADGDESTEFVYGGQAEWQLLEEYDAMGAGTTLRASYVYGNYIDEIVEALRDTDNDLVVDDALYYHQDDLFSVYAITDASGAVVERYDYSDYGEVTVQRADGTVKPEEYWLGNRHTYTGRLVERDTGLLQYRHRYMSPTLGRFVQRDPLGFVDGMSHLAYTRSNSLRYTDPLGKKGFEPFAYPGGGPLFKPPADYPDKGPFYDPWWDHYQNGNGVPFDLDDHPSIQRDFRSHKSIQAIKDEVNNLLRGLCKMLGKGLSCDGNRESSPFHNTIRRPYDVTRRPGEFIPDPSGTFPIGNGFLRITFTCTAKLKYCEHDWGCGDQVNEALRESVSCDCDVKFMIWKDEYADPTDLGPELPGGTPFPIEDEWREERRY